MGPSDADTVSTPSTQAPNHSTSAGRVGAQRRVETDAGVRTVKSAEHTVAVLEYLASRGERPARIKEITEATGIPRSSAYALLKTLTDLGWVERDSSGLLYGVGLRALIAGVSYLDHDPAVHLVTPWLIRLCEELGETVHLARLDGDDVVYLATRESSQYLRVLNRVGRRLPATTTSLGKAVLAGRSPEELSHLLPDVLPGLTPHSIVDRDQLLADLAETRRRGYAIDQEENTPGLRCIGVALPYGTTPGVVTDAISCSVPLGRLTAEHEQLIIDRLTAAATEISITSRRPVSAWSLTKGLR